VLSDTGDFSKKLHLKVHAISAGARARVEAAGGSVEIVTA
jgi:ribosomal protein L15